MYIHCWIGMSPIYNFMIYLALVRLDIFEVAVDQTVWEKGKLDIDHVYDPT